MKKIKDYMEQQLNIKIYGKIMKLMISFPNYKNNKKYKKKIF